MNIDIDLLDAISADAKMSSRLRAAYDMRTSPEDNSQRMLNAIEPNSVFSIHRHQMSSETIVVVRGKIRQNIYDEFGTLITSVICAPNTDTIGISIPMGVWHNTECLESGTVIFECKDGKYVPLKDEDILR